jgi:hypothetical protein
MLPVQPRGHWLRYRHSTGPTYALTRWCRSTLESLRLASRSFAEPSSHKRRPVNVVDAQFSVQYAVAAAPIDRQLALPLFAPERIVAQDLRAMMDKTSCYTTPKLNRNYPRERPTEVSITLSRWSHPHQCGPSTVGRPSKPDDIRPAAGEVQRTGFRRAVGICRGIALWDSRAVVGASQHHGVDCGGRPPQH